VSLLLVDVLLVVVWLGLIVGLFFLILLMCICLVLLVEGDDSFSYVFRFYIEGGIEYIEVVLNEWIVV